MSSGLPAGWHFVDDTDDALPKGWSFAEEEPPVAAKPIPDTPSALKAFFMGDEKGGGAKELFTAPVTVAKESYRQGAADPEIAALAEKLTQLVPGGVLPGAQEAVTGGLGFLGKLLPAMAPRTAQVTKDFGPLGAISPQGQGAAIQDVLEPILNQFKDLGQTGANLAGFDVQPSQASEMTRALRQGDVGRFLSLLGSTTPAMLSAGLGSKPGVLGRSLGMGKKPVAPSAASQALAANLDTSALKSEILPKAVFPGGPPARSAPLPELTLPQTIGEESGGRAMRVLERNVEASLPGTGQFQKLRAEADAAIADYGSKVGDYISGQLKTSAGSRAAVSRTVQESMEQAKELLRAKASRLFDQVWENPALKSSKGTDRRFPLKDTPLQEMAEEVRPRIEALVKRTGTESGLLNTLRTLTGDAKNKASRFASLSELQDLKNAMFNKHETAKLGISSGTAGRLAKAADDTIAQILEQQGGKGLKARWEVAKRKWKELSDVNDSKFVQQILAADKDNAYVIATQGSVQDLDLAWKLIKPADRQLVKARVLQDALEAAAADPIPNFKKFLYKASGWDPEAGMDRAFNQAKFATKLRQVGPPEKLARMFTKDELAAIDTLNDAMARAGGNSWTNVSGLLLNGYLYFNTLRGLGGDLGALAKAGSAALGTNLMARLMTNPGAARAGARFLDAIGKTGEVPYTNPAAAYWGQQMAKELQNTPDPDGGSNEQKR